MRVLLIEDDESVLPILEQELDRVSPGIGFLLARSRESAFTILQSHDDIDLVLCDIRIPSHDGALDTDDVHGRAVFDRTREVLPGTPIRFLTAYGTPEIISEPLSNAPTLDVFGTGQSYPLSGYFDKSSYEKCIACIA
ncbi:MAG: response regulator, partial [Proteobacteria bacterium]|nr:response regulator [Pseudomonadota bacterium]